MRAENFDNKKRVINLLMLAPVIVLTTIAQWHCHINRRRARESVSSSYQAAAAAAFQTLNASIRNRLNTDLLSK
jgi:hypothetical protein